MMFLREAGAAVELREQLAALGAGGAFTTVTDMSSYMLALLDHGTANRTRMLSVHSTDATLARHAGTIPDFPGLGYGVEKQPCPGPSAVGHGGDSTGTHNQYTLLTKAGVGIYVATNTHRAGDIIRPR